MCCFEWNDYDKKLLLNDVGQRQRSILRNEQEEEEEEKKMVIEQPKQAIHTFPNTLPQ
jgi:hypothetical protein